MKAERKPLGAVLLTGAFLAASLTGIVGFWAAWPRTSNTSPRDALFALVWSCTCIITSVLTWRRSRFAGSAFIAAIGLLLFPARSIVPGGQLLLPSFVVIILLAFFGYRYLRRVHEPRHTRRNLSLRPVRRDNPRKIQSIH